MLSAEIPSVQEGSRGPPLWQGRAEVLLFIQNRILRMVATGEPLDRTLNELIHHMESESGEAVCSVLLLEEDGQRLRWGAAPSLPEAYNQDVDGLLVGPNKGSCGTAVFRRAPVIVTDIEHDPLWDEARALALSHGLRACTSVPILDSSQQVLGTFAFYYRKPQGPSAYDLKLIEISRDLTGIAIERTRILRELREAIETRDTFLSIASHEMKTPLTSLNLQLKTVLRTQEQSPAASLPPEVLVPRLRGLERQAARLQQLINELLDVSTLVSGHLHLELEDSDLSALTRETIGRFWELIGPRAVPFNLSTSGPVIGRWDRAHLEQALTNLLSNAVKFGQGKPVDISVGRGPGIAWVAVTDHGIGIAPEDQARIFQKFERAVSARHYGGLGLGLWISRQIVEALGGHLTVHSAPGQGSTFTVELPLEPSS
jgi:signal transduction histidine kinase